MNLSISMQNKLQQVFADNNMPLELKDDHVIAINSQDSTRKKIQTIINSAGFCPIVSYNKINNYFAFTIVPFTIPNWFLRAQPQAPRENLPQRASTSISTSVEPVDNNPNNLFKDNLLTQSPLNPSVNLFYQDINIELATRNTKKGHIEHFEHNKRNILSLAKNLQGEALILGLGNGDDIPLLELAAQFDQITALDMDVEGMKKAVGKLPPLLQNKFVLIQKDLTGIILIISKKIETLIEQNFSKVKCFRLVTDILNESIQSYDRRVMLSEKKYHFVISSMVTSQLFSQAIPCLMGVLENKYPGINQLPSNQNREEAIYNFGKQLCLNHLENLSEWTHPNGKIYYADTTHISLVNVDRNQFKQNPNKPSFKIIQTIEALPNEPINEVIETGFSTVRNNDSWSWCTRVPNITPEGIYSGNIMKVVAHFLQPKDGGEEAVATVELKD